MKQDLARGCYGLLALGIFGCSRDALSTGLTVEQFADEEAYLHCRNAQSCCKASGYEYDFRTCVEETTKLYRTWSPTGPLNVYDPMMAERCIESRISGSATCSTAIAIDECGTVFNGVLPPGASCQSDNDCAAPYGGGAMCVGSPDPGTCTNWARGKAGETCHGGYEVDRFGGAQYGWNTAINQVTLCFSTDNLYCSQQTGTCLTRGGLGAACFGASTCAAPYFCDATQKLCRAKGAVGQPCDDKTLPCVDSAYCDLTSHYCMPQKHDGDECTRDVECPRDCVPQDSGVSICRPTRLSRESCEITSST